MLSKTSKLFFDSFNDFQLQSDSSVSEFCRLAKEKGWPEGSSIFRSFWWACFQTDCPITSERLEKQDDPRKLHSVPTVSVLQDETDGVSLLESSLRQLDLQSLATNNGDLIDQAILTPTASIAGDGVQIRYFDTFPYFEPRNAAPLREEFGRLAKFQGWSEQSDVYKVQFLRCCSDEFKYFCGDSNSRLASWQQLCIDVTGISPPPGTQNQCKKLLQGYFVNIFDFIDCKRADVKVHPVFSTKRSFRKAAAKKGNLFPKAAAKQNPYLSVLLERLFAHVSTR